MTTPNFNRAFEEVARTNDETNNTFFAPFAPPPDEERGQKAERIRQRMWSTKRRLPPPPPLIYYSRGPLSEWGSCVIKWNDFLSADTSLMALFRVTDHVGLY